MKTPREKKLEELVEHYKAYHDSTRSPAVKIPDYNKWNEYGNELESELASMEEPEVNAEDMNGIKERVLEEYKKGNIVYAGIEGLMVIPLKEFLEQPTDGLLYDLNRNETVVLTLIDDPKWVNDYAVAKVIRALRKRIEELNAQQQDKELPDDDEIGNLVKKICYQQLAEEQSDDFIEKVWIVKEWMRNQLNNR